MFERWREHRRGRRQQALERAFFEHGQARCSDIGSTSSSIELLNASARADAYGTVSMGFAAGLAGGP
ncbi:MAG TPA: hypothetical protein VGO80_23200 [Solirubrobacteraceae bacterium]|jgi:hypothetical protein|nr:hypothetical protein [Solirubrobacteraceae bacterium]